MHTPYTTKSGLKIGSRYQENGNTQPIDDLDMLRLQDALILTPKQKKEKKIEIVLVKISFVVFVAILFSPFIFGK
jgi:hypothetical protein